MSFNCQRDARSRLGYDLSVRLTMTSSPDSGYLFSAVMVSDHSGICNVSLREGAALNCWRAGGGMRLGKVNLTGSKG